MEEITCKIEIEFERKGSEAEEIGIGWTEMYIYHLYFFKQTRKIATNKYMAKKL